jgi:3-isopropylmalate/(R)-2-methylmalate dehydratase small subunit
MKQVRTIDSRVTPLDRSDVDTDQIIPAVWLKRVERSGFGEGLFSAWRQDPGFILNNEAYKGANVLVARENFGCGSSREHAPWALEDYGFQAVVAPSFADIFRNNCLNIGLVPVVAADEKVDAVIKAGLADPNVAIHIDVEKKTWSCPAAAIEDEPFEIDDFSQYRILNGLDEIGLTLQHEGDISRFEAQRESFKPRVG